MDMKDRKHKEYGRLSAEGLRMLLALYEDLIKQEEELHQEIINNPKMKSKFFDPNNKQLVWADYYEMPFIPCLIALIKELHFEADIRQMAESDDHVQAISHLVEKFNNEDDGEELTPAQWLWLTRLVYPLGSVVLKNLRALMVYGCYLNDLIEIAREGKPHKRDKALLDAIKIDPSIVACKTGAARVSRAVLMQDKKFLHDLQTALGGKLGAKEETTYKKMRFVLQVLHEANALTLSDNELSVLFVKKLKLYAPVPGAEKNISQFAYNFKQKKATI